MTYRVDVIRRRTRIRVLTVAFLTGTLLVAAGARPAVADTTDVNAKESSWDDAAARLGIAGSLWDPVKTAGLSRRGSISVVADGLTVVSGSATGGDTFAGATYGRGSRSFTISEKWANTDWAAEPAFTTSRAKVGSVLIPIGMPGMRVRVKAVIYANCFVQPADSDPSEVPPWFRCARSHVLSTGGVLVMTARPASTTTAPGNTSIVIQSVGLTYSQLVAIATGLQQVAGATADGAGSAQMRGMCDQMVTGRMTFDQAKAFTEASGYSARVGSIDGVQQALTADYRPDRFTLAIASNVVASCTYG